MLCSSANTAATNRIFSSMGQISRHGILHLLPWHLIRYPCCRSILLPMLPVCTPTQPSPKTEGTLSHLTDSPVSGTFLDMMNFKQFMAKFPDEAACREYLVMRRWPNGPVCPRCNK